MMQRWKLGLASWLVIGGALALGGGLSPIASSANCVLAQITPDGTLGSENSTVTSTGAVDQIDGGAARGANLFHSFQEFNVGEGRAAVFTNPAGIENILSRVTGANPSNILGTLGVSGGNANLFLINPNGFVFSANASLNIGGSFVASTANALQFGNIGFFSATDKNIPSPLLTINPSALLFNQINQNAAIQNNSIAPARRDPAGFDANGLRVPDGNSLLLVGGNVSMDGGRLNANGGRVELGGLAELGSVLLGVDADNLSLTFPSNVALADISLTNQAGVYVTGAGGGNIAVNARNLEILGGSILSGDITLNATLILIDGAQLLSGQTTQNITNFDPTISGLINRSAVPIDTEVAQTCTPGSSQSKSEFVVTGRGGLPPSPDEMLSSDAIQVNWVTLNPQVENRSIPNVSTNSTAPDPAPIVEAQGWVVDDNGFIVLTASAPSATPNNSWQTPANCHATRNSS